MFHFYYYHLPELQKMRSVSGDYSLRAAVHHRYAFVLRLPTQLFSATKRTKPCLHVSPTGNESSVQVLSTLGPSATAAKSSSVQTVVPIEPGAVSNACAISTGKDKFQHFVILTVSGRWGSRLSALFKSADKCAPPAPHHLENNPSPSKQRTLATGPPSGVNGSSVCLEGFAGEKGSELSDPLCGNDRLPDYSPIMPEPRGPEEDQGMPGGDAVATKGKATFVRHQISLDQNPAARTGACDATPGNRVIEHEKEGGFLDENVDDRTTYPTGETGPDLEVAPSSALTLALCSVPNLGPTHEVEVSQVSRQPVVESNFLHFYSTLKPYIVRRELPSRPVQRTPPPIDDGPLPESDGFRVLEGPFTTPPGGTNTSEAEGPPCATPPLPTNNEVLHEREPEIKHSNTYLAPAIAAALTDPTNHQLISQPIAPARLSDQVLGKAMTWDIDILHARTGFSQTLSSTLRSMENKWRILEFDLAFGMSDASMFRDNYGFAYKPLALQLPCSSPRITELDDETEPVLRKATGEIQSCNGGASGSGSTQVRQGTGSRAHVQQSRSTQLPCGKKRANEEEDDDRKGKKRERREEPPVGDDPSPSGSEDESVFCPYWIESPQNCKKKSCKSPKKNLSKLKEHLRRAHFLHLDCPFENCKFHAGDKFQINRHQKTAHAGEIREPIPRTTDSELLRKNEALGTRNLKWDEIRDICFRVESKGPIMSPDGAGDFESEGGEEEGEGLSDEDDEDREGQEEHDNYETRGEQIEHQGGYTSHRGAAAAVEENHQENPISPSPPEANRSMLSNAASTIIDTPEPFPGNDGFPFDFSNFSNFSWPDPLGGSSQGEGHLPSPAPDHYNFPNSGQPPFSSPANAVTWEMVEDHTVRKFETFRETFFEGLGNRQKTSPEAALVDIDRVFGEIWRSARAALNLPDGGSGPVASLHKESLTCSVPPVSQSMLPYDLSIDQMLFQDISIGGDSSTLPSLVLDSLDSQSSHSSMPYSFPPQAFYSSGIPAVASGSQPTGPGMAGPQAEGSAIHNQYGDVLAHRNPEGRWSVGGGPREV